MEFNKSYSPKDFEKSMYENWEKNGSFLPRKSTTGKTFYIPIPPPNVT
jgi:valyl-tRNA synthetase